MKKLSKILLISVCIFAFSIAFAQKESFTANNLSIIDLQQNAISNIQYNTNLSDANNAGVTVRGDVNSAIDSLEKALTYTDTNSIQALQLELSLFTLEITQQDKTKSKQTIQNLVKNFPDYPIVQIYATAYANVLRFGDYQDSLDKLKKSNWKEMSHYIKVFDVLDKSFNIPINTNSKDINIDSNARPIIVVLGYALNSDGSMDNILFERLESTLQVYNKYPNTMIIVSGGGVQSGVTEAYQMQKWLIANKVGTDKIILEDLSISTVWNALNTISIIKNIEPAVQDIILVTSDSHIRRAYAVFQQASNNSKLPVQIHNLASKTKGYNISEPISNQEKSLIIKDTLRTAGIWQMPGMVL